MADIELVSPFNGDVLHVFQPLFGFYYTIPTVTNIGIQVSTTPDMLTIIAESQMGLNPDEWEGIELIPNRHIDFVFPVSKLIAPNGIYYWMVYVWDAAVPGWVKSVVRKIEISEAVYSWRMGSPVVEFQPARGGVEISTFRTGCENIIKHVFRITFIPMRESKMLEIKTVYDVRRFVLRDSFDNVYIVYWGECDRNLAGVAFPAKKPEFGIRLINLKTGALRWGGAATFTEE